MKHHRTPSTALFAALFLVFATTSTLAFAAPGGEPVAKPAAEPVAKPAAEPVAKPAAEPVAKLAAEPIAKPAAEPPGGTTASLTFRTTEGDDGHGAARRSRRDHGLTSILVPVAFFLCILLLVGTIQYMGLRKDRNKHQTLQLMVEKGAQIPAELITSQKPRGSDLRRGLVLVGAGLGISLFLLMTKDARNSGAFGMGLIPALIGAGYLLAWKLEGRKQAEKPLPIASYTQDDNFASTQRDESDAGDTPE